METAYLNGKLIDHRQSGIDLSGLLRGNYVYAAVLTDQHQPLHIDRHLSYALNSYRQLYGVDIEPWVDRLAISHSITDLLGRNHKPLTSNTVYIHFIPRKELTLPPDIAITCGESTIYHGYTAFSLRPKAVITNYELPFAEHRTSVSLTTSTFMEDYAKRHNAHVALRANRSGVLVSCGDYPIFVKRGDTLITPLPDQSIGNSVERDMMFSLCNRADIPIVEDNVLVSDLPDIEEIIVVGTMGISSILECSGHYFYNLTSERLSPIISKAYSTAFDK